MAKNRSKKKRNGVASMEITDSSVPDSPQAMDTSESGLLKKADTSNNIKTKKGRPMKRSKNARKKKAIGKAISKSEQSHEKISKRESKSLLTQSAKSLYD